MFNNNAFQYLAIDFDAVDEANDREFSWAIMTQDGTNVTEGEGGWLQAFDEDITTTDAIARALAPLGYQAGEQFQSEPAACFWLEPLQEV